jgi:hypothetical protein
VLLAIATVRFASLYIYGALPVPLFDTACQAWAAFNKELFDDKVHTDYVAIRSSRFREEQRAGKTLSLFACIDKALKDL